MPDGAQKATDSARDKLKTIHRNLQGVRLTDMQAQGIMYEISKLTSLVENRRVVHDD